MDAARQAMGSIRKHPPSAVLAFASVCYELDELLAGVNEVVGDAPVLGATTAGEIMDGPHEKSVVVAILASPFLAVRIGIGRDVSKGWNRAVAEAVGCSEIQPYFSPGGLDIWRQLELDGKSAFGMLFSPGNTKYADSKSFEILEELKKLSGGLLPIVGGSCADDWRMEQNHVLLGGNAYPDSILIAVFETQLTIGMGLSHGFKPTGEKILVTRADGHEVIELDNRPAAPVYAELTGFSEAELEGKHLTFTTGKVVGSPERYGQYSIKVASYFTERRGIRLSQPVMEGIPLAIMEPDRESMVAAGRDALRTALLRGRIKDPALALVFSCALRSKTSTVRRSDELDRMKEKLPDVPIAGFYSFGEQGLGDDWANRHDNNVISVLVFGQEMSRAARVAMEQKRLLKELKDTLEEKEKAEVKINYLNSLLLAIRNINQIIVREKDTTRMLEKACENLVNTKGLQCVWIALFDESGQFKAGVEAGLGKDFSYIVDQLRKGEMTYCTQVALAKPGVNLIDDSISTCGACIIAKKTICKNAMSIRLEHGGKVFGVMTALRSDTHLQEKKEQALIEEVAGDIAFALNNLELEKEKRRVEEALRSEEEKFRTLVEKSPFGIALIARDGRYKYVNPKFIEMFGYSLEDVKTGKKWFRKAFPQSKYRKEVIEAWLYDLETMEVGESRLRTFRVVCKDGSEKLVFFNSVSLANGNQFIIYHDMTEKERLEQQLRQAQRLEAMGTLAGGIAHDFNNILAAIVGYTELAMMETAEKSNTRHNLEQVLLASKRAKELVKQILTFCRQTEQEKKPVNVASIFKEALKLLRASIPATVEIREDIEVKPAASTVLADPTQMHQVFMNLCTNAAHAMRETGGTLGIEVKNVEIRQGEAPLAHLSLTPGTYLKLSISDTGHGMSPEVMERIFEPYFTTKDKGEGTGLGLAMVHGIAKDHGGTINVYSEPEKGSIFHVYLPVIEKEEEEVREPAIQLPRGNERILLVDDEAMLVEVGSQMLELLGYRVTTRTSSVEALELFRAGPDQFDLVITDMTMPQMSGDILARELRKIRPSIPVIICTGFSERISPDRARLMGIQGFAMKPLVIKDLAGIVREVLDKRKFNS